MTDPSKLDRLAESVEAATGPDRELEAEVHLALYCTPTPEGYRWGGYATPPELFPWVHPDGTPTNANIVSARPVTRSLDAAMTLADVTGRSLTWLLTEALRRFSENSYSSYKDDREAFARFFTATCLREAASKARADEGKGQ